MASIERFNNLADLINCHLRLHEGIQLRDIYKMVHQSVFGPEHLDAAYKENAIAEEMHGSDVGFEELLLEPISVDGGACRINLRVAEKNRIAPHLIAEAVRESAEIFGRSRDELVRLWNDAGDALEHISQEYDREDFAELTRMLEEKDFPPLHHSRSYRALNRPAYRVLMRAELLRLMRPPSAGARWP